MESESTSAATLPGRILVVEDDRQILAIISLLLEDEGYEIVTASDGKQALARLRDGPNPDLIILDLMLPALDGWEFRTIQRADPELSRIPVLAVSADSSAKAEAIDATSFLRKPFGAEDLLERVHKILSERVRMEARMAETERLVSLGKL
ncbi:MAG TPA: response regulator, partial [Polyangia bacterium]|nr:response regulator [Polyangia bacterium]